MDRCQGKCLLTGIATRRIRVRRAIDAARNLGVNIGADNDAAMLTGGQIRFDNQIKYFFDHGSRTLLRSCSVFLREHQLPKVKQIC